MKDIPGYEGLYAATEDGQIWSYRKQKFLKPIEHSGYLQLGLFDANGKRKQLSIHRLIALTYVPNPDNLPIVDHIDQNKLNNSIENLRWVTHQGNILNRDWEQCHKKMSESHLNTPEEIRKERTQKVIQVCSKPIEMRDKNNHDILIKTYPSCCQAARQEFDDVRKNGNISRCARGELKSAYGYFWTYANTSCETDV